MRRKILSLSVATLSLILSSTALAGVVFEVETTYHSGPSSSETMTAYAQGCNLKMEILPGGNTSRSDSSTDSVREGSMQTGGSQSISQAMEEMIYKCAGGGTMVVINHEEQYYHSPPNKSASGDTNPFTDILKDVPAEQRGALEGLMKQMGKGGQGFPGQPQKSETRVVNTGQKVVKNGHNTTVIEIYENGALSGKLYGAAIGNIDGGRTMMDAILAYSKFLEEQLGGFGGDNDFGKEFEALKKAGLFPIAGEEFEDGDLDEEWTLRSSKRRTLDPAEFEPPAGYKRRSMFPQ